MPIRFALVFVVLVSVPLSWGQNTLSQVQRELDRVQKEIEREKKTHQEEKQRYVAFDKAKKEKIEAVRTQTKATEDHIETLKNQLARAKHQRNAFNAQTTQLEAKQQAYAQRVALEADSLASLLDGDFPYQRERRAEELRTAARLVRDRAITVQEGLSRVFSALQGSIDLGYGTEVYVGSYQSQDGKGYDGNYLRVGAVFLAFATPDGKKAALLTRGDSSYVWMDEKLPSGARQQILTAIRIADGKEAPDLAYLPLEVPEWTQEEN